MTMKPNTKVKNEFIEAARHILRKVDESPDIVDQLSHMIQVEHSTNVVPETRVRVCS